MKTDWLITQLPCVTFIKLIINNKVNKGIEKTFSKIELLKIASKKLYVLDIKVCYV